MNEERDYIQDLPQTVYRYLDWHSEHGSKILTHQIIYFAEPSKLNDPYDCSLIIRYDHLPEETLKRRFQRLLSRHNLSQIETLFAIDQAISRIRSDGFDDHMQQIVRQHVESRFGVCSMSTKWDSLLMWGYYADSHRGFCVGFDRQKLCDFFDSHFISLTHVRADAVSYTREARIYVAEDPGPEEIIKLLTTKSSVWEHEDEIRFTLVGDPSHPDLRVADRTLVIPSEIVSEVYMGWRSDRSTRSEIESTLAARAPHVKRFEILPTPGEFRLQRLELKHKI